MAILLRLCVAVILVFATSTSIRAGTSSPSSLVTGGRNLIVWQEFHPWLMMTDDLTTGRVGYFLSHVDKSKLNLKPAMPGNWSPIGSAIKWLFFIGTNNGVDALMAHQVDYHQDFVIVPSAQRQMGCGMLGNKLVFGQQRVTMAGDHYPVDMYDYDAENGACALKWVSDSEKMQFAQDTGLIVYRANLGGGNYAIYGHYFDLPGEFLIAARNGVEPSVCSPLVAWAEVNGAGYNIMGLNLETGEMRNVAYTTANPPCPEAGRGVIFWQDARNASTAPDIYGYDWSEAQEFAVTTASGSQSKLRVCDDLVTWVTGTVGYQILWGAKISTPARVVDLRADKLAAESVGLAWTSIGGAAYDLRMRTDGPVTESNWSSSTQVAGLGAPQSVGMTETAAVQSGAGDRWFGIKVQLQNGSYTALSNVIRAHVSASAFGSTDGAYVTFEGVVTGIESDRSFYCQAAMGPRAVRVMPRTGEALVAPGQSVVVTGVLGQDAQSFGPLMRQATVAGRVAVGLPQAAAMSNRAMGGYDARFGGTAQRGAPNCWMRVRTWGKVSGLVSTTGGCSFYISDGSKLTDNAGKGVLVTGSFAAPANLANGVFVVVEGICGVSRTSGRWVKVTAQDGIRVQ